MSRAWKPNSPSFFFISLDQQTCADCRQSHLDVSLICCGKVSAPLLRTLALLLRVYMRMCTVPYSPILSVRVALTQTVSYLYSYGIAYCLKSRVWSLPHRDPVALTTITSVNVEGAATAVIAVGDAEPAGAWGAIKYNTIAIGV